MEQFEHSDWNGSTDGTPWMQRTLISLLHYTPIPVMYGFMSVAIPFYMAFDHKGYLASYRFFRHRIGYGVVKSFFNVFLNEYSLGKVVIDRFAMFSGKSFKITIDGAQAYEKLASGESGFVMLSSHIGNFEMAGYSLKSDKKKFYALLFPGETQTMMRGRSELFAKSNITMIPVSEDMSHIFLLNQALVEGGIVSMAGDRLFGSPKSVTCKFFGEDAKFPKGPFVLAAQRNVPMLGVFVMKEKWNAYKIILRPLNEGGTVESLASDFAKCLEETVKEYPQQWYNFYDFWK